MNSAKPVSPADIGNDRLQIVRRARVWSRTDVRSKNLLAGPGGAGAFQPNQQVTCDYVEDKLSGGTPKFKCAIGKDEFRVKYGERNGEVFGEVAASRLLWALGFPTDAQYPVRIICRGCSDDPWTKRDRAEGQHEFPMSVVERKYAAREITPGDKPGWAWPELDLIDERAGGATKAQRDALKLLAVFMQHTDTKPEQQRIVCLDGRDGEAACRQPLMMLNDIGLTFGRANRMNTNTPGSTDLRSWEKVPIWRDAGQVRRRAAEVADRHARAPGDQRTRPAAAGQPAQRAHRHPDSSAVRSVARLAAHGRDERRRGSGAGRRVGRRVQSEAAADRGTALSEPVAAAACFCLYLSTVIAASRCCGSTRPLNDAASFRIICRAITRPVTVAPARTSTTSVATSCPSARPSTVMSRANTSPRTSAVAAMTTAPPSQSN